MGDHPLSWEENDVVGVTPICVMCPTRVNVCRVGEGVSFYESTISDPDLYLCLSSVISCTL